MPTLHQLPEHLKREICEADRLGTQTWVTVNQNGVESLASALLNAQAYEIFVDDQEVGVLDGSKLGCSWMPGKGP